MIETFDEGELALSYVLVVSFSYILCIFFNVEPLTAIDILYPLHSF